MDPLIDIQSIETAIQQGRFFHAHNLALEATKQFPETLRIRQLLGLSMSKSGAKNAALDYLNEIYKEGNDDPETSGILAGVYKDVFKMTSDTSHAMKSLEIYQRNFDKEKSYYTGINAATMHQIVGNENKAKAVAAEVVELLGTPEENDFWATATLAEAYLLQKKNNEAAHYYELAASISTGKYGQLNSTYSQLLLLKHYLQIPGAIMDLFLPPGIAAFTGHMIDYNRSARFPESIVDQVAEQIRLQLAEHKISIGYTSLACGSDILFSEALIEMGGEVNVFLPFAKEDFLKTSVSFAGDHWVERFEKVLEKCQLHYITEERYFNDSVLFDFLGKVIIGASVLRGSLMHVDPYLLSVQSIKDQEMKVGGTRSVIDLWPFASRHININTDAFLPEAQADVVMVEDEKKEDVKTVMGREVRYILFADIVGFSKLEEEQTPQFMLVLLKEMSEQLADYPKPNVLNTWGDSIFAVYKNAKFAVDFAMKVRNIFTKTNWERDGLPKDLSIRIALHAGPVFVGKDPLTQKMNVYGSHINRAARMEPVAIPGLIYASNQFASALVAEAPDEYDLNHVGIISLAKEYGTQEVYLIEKAKESNF